MIKIIKKPRRWHWKIGGGAAAPKAGYIKIYIPLDNNKRKKYD
jgi:hypothetical protein